MAAKSGLPSSAELLHVRNMYTESYIPIALTGFIPGQSSVDPDSKDCGLVVLIAVAITFM